MANQGVLRWCEARTSVEGEMGFFECIAGAMPLRHHRHLWHNARPTSADAPPQDPS